MGLWGWDRTVLVSRCFGAQALPPPPPTSPPYLPRPCVRPAHASPWTSPSPEMAAPPDLQQAAALVDMVVERIGAGKTVVLHCK